ncbi:GLPGLI family protein [Pedobacter sp. KR3-3]|uniref:GLPGLI family protein n=1 Tax=Pedobacter albus TaxID=3113905 RepID=A0ABU7I3U2_9SPHI|nr:GLPGLI family protein [Pedobacter sp. KR3-3]MEE1944077.1 GLPGLI family protein [Pedobacter sp. KR3-3]
MKTAIITTLLTLGLLGVKAQQVFVSSAKITFEKKVNLQRQMADNTWLSDDAKDKMKKYISSFWEYAFNETTSLYKAQKKESQVSDNVFMFSSGENTAQMYTDLSKGTRIIKKPVMGEDYILNDTVPHVNWKIMHDVRKIAGYDCRKAIGVINDTVYVVAFYTDDILFKGGPEGFTGLPGMILGLAIPRYNTTWFATKVEAVNVPVMSIAEPSKGKKTDSEKDFKKLVDLYTRYDDKKNPRKIEEIKKEIYGLIL